MFSIFNCDTHLGLLPFFLELNPGAKRKMIVGEGVKFE